MGKFTRIRYEESAGPTGIGDEESAARKRPLPSKCAATAIRACNACMSNVRCGAGDARQKRWWMRRYPPL